MAWQMCAVLLCVLGAVQSQNGFPRNNAVNGRVFDALGRVVASDDDVVYGDEIPGVAGVDYPVLADVPQTGFSCQDIGLPGYYADQQTGCQVYYVCHKSGRGNGRLCPNGTVFNQETLVCDWWYNVDCARAAEYYSVNLDVIQAMEEVDAANGKTARTPTNVNFRRPVTVAPLLNRFSNPRLPLQGATRLPTFNFNNNNVVNRPRANLNVNRPLVNLNSNRPLVNLNSNRPLINRPLVNLNSNRPRFNINDNLPRSNNFNSDARSPSKYTDGESASDNNGDKEFNGYPYDVKSDLIDRAYLPPKQ